VLRPGGVLLAAAIGRFMAVLDWAQSVGLTADVAAKLVPVLSTGVHDPTLGFTEAFFHTAAQLQQKVAETGFANVRVVGIEGPAWTIVDTPGDDADARLDSALRCAQLTENFAAIVDGRQRPPNGSCDGSLASACRRAVASRWCGMSVTSRLVLVLGGARSLMWPELGIGTETFSKWVLEW
jgi:hypothetical protein